MGLLRVRDKETGVERTVTEKAYSIIPHRYTVLGKVDDAGNESPYSPAATQQKKSASPAAVVDMPSFESPTDQVTEHIAPVVELPETPAPEVKTKNKPGPKPKSTPVERRQGARNSARTSENG